MWIDLAKLGMGDRDCVMDGVDVDPALDADGERVGPMNDALRARRMEPQHRAVAIEVNLRQAENVAGAQISRRTCKTARPVGQCFGPARGAGKAGGRRHGPVAAWIDDMERRLARQLERRAQCPRIGGHSRALSAEHARIDGEGGILRLARHRLCLSALQHGRIASSILWLV